MKKSNYGNRNDELVPKLLYRSDYSAPQPVHVGQKFLIEDGGFPSAKTKNSLINSVEFRKSIMKKDCNYGKEI